MPKRLAFVCALVALCVTIRARALDELVLLKDLPPLDKRGSWRDTLEDLQTQGIPQNWTLLGPISNENTKSFDKQLDPELSDDWSKPMTDNLGRLLRVSLWSKPKDEDGCYVDLYDVFSNPPESPVALAMTVIDSPVDGPALLWFENVGRAIVYFNNKQILNVVGKKARVEGSFSALYPLPIELKRGRNVLKVKLLKERRMALKGWGFFARVERNDLDWRKQLLGKLKELYPDEDNAQPGGGERLILARAYEKSNAPEQAAALYQEVRDHYASFEELSDEAGAALKRLKDGAPKDEPLLAAQAWHVAEERFRILVTSAQTIAADRLMRDFVVRFPFSEEAGLALCNRGGLRLDYACDESARPFFELALREFSRNETVRARGVQGMEFARLYLPERAKLEANREAEMALSAIQRQLRNGNERDNAAGLKALGELLVAKPGAWVSAGGPESYPRWASLTELAREFMATLTPDERKLFREPLARQAELLYRQAAEMSDAVQLEEIALNFPGAEASAKALNHAGNLYLDHGLYTRAAQAFRTLLRDFRGSGLIDEALAAAKEIRALEGMGQLQAARDAAQKMAQDYAAGKVVFGGQPVSVAAFVEATQKRLDAERANESAQNRAEYDTFGANIRRLGPEALAGANGPIPEALEWMHPIKMSEADARAVGSWYEEKLYRHYEPFPVAANGRVFVASREDVRAIDLATGKQIWEKNWGNAGGYWNIDRFCGFPQSMPAYKDGKVFVRVTSGGYSILRCYNAENGDEKWDTDKNSALRGLMWSSEPLAANNLVYASFFDPVDHDMVRSGMAALDARTGALVWKKYFGVGNSGIRVNERGNGYRDRHGGGTQNYYRVTMQLGPPSAYEGVVYASTGLGSLAALNAYSGEILWVTEYPRLRAGTIAAGNAELDGGFSSRFYKVIARGPSSPVVGDQVVALAPRDAAGIIGFDRRSGEMRWSHELLDARFIAGVCNGKLLAADDTVTALDLNTGKIEWEYGSNEKHLFGQPGYSGGMLYLPYEDGLKYVNARTGTLASQWSWDQKCEGPLGNLVVVGTRILGVNYSVIGCIRGK
ncbi:MAG TPA: PQQ-binding-like beta-propeller repeat protein [Planctomycetota bacterium]|nr:PQQ-binding-like beta-propeller repeat protein [Planctomycetota bacterium]